MTTSLVRLLEVGLTYPGPPAVRALSSANLDVGRGQYVAVVGKSGAGKSTLLNVIGLLDRHTEGTYQFAGIDTKDLTERNRAQVRAERIGFVFQSFHLLPHRTALENVAMAQLYSGVRRNLRIARAAECLDRVGLRHRSDALPTTLSGGESQRVAIARALAQAPDLLLCDEPTGNLDSSTAAGILALLDELHTGGVTVMVITHDSAVAARAQRTVALHDGVLA